MNEKNMVEWTFEVDQDIYDSACLICKVWGTSIENMTAAFIHFCVRPENLPLLESFLSERNDWEERQLINQKIFKGVLDIAYQLNEQASSV